MSISKNPSIIELYDIIKKYDNLPQDEKDFFTQSNFDSIYTYLYHSDIINLYTKKDTQNIKNNIQQENFYLGGHIYISVNKPITNEIIKKIDTIYHKLDFSACWGMTTYTVQKHYSSFQNFKKFYEEYKLYINRYNFEKNVVNMNN
jgi:hypothetical protein